MSTLLLALFLLVFFAPLAFVYGRTVAAGIHAEARQTGRPVARIAPRRLIVPAILAAAMALRLADWNAYGEPSRFYTGNGIADLVVSAVLLVGTLAAVLFFLSVPYVMGRLFGAAAALAGAFEAEIDAPNPLRFGFRRPREGEGPDTETTPLGSGRGQAMVRPLIIAIDGPAASGKGTLARRVAAAYGLAHLDTGLSYRAVARTLLEAGQPLDDELLALRAAERLDFAAFDRASLAAHAIGEAASRVAVMPLVRRSLVEGQRRFAGASPAGAVLDGRDIGTIVLPQADVKLFVTASPERRARRRHEEILGQGGGDDYQAVLADLKRRDARDAGRTDSPMRAAEDAHLLDTSEMDIEAAFQAACDLIDASLSARDGA